MERNIVLTIAALALVAIGLAIVMPGGRQPDPNPKLPWEITANPDGSSTVFGLTLGRSTFADAARLLDEDGEVTLFAGGDGGLALEVFFDGVFLSGLRADMVMTLDLSPTTLQGMYDRGIRAAKLGSGETKVTLSTGDAAAAGSAAIRHITYLPTADLDPDLLVSHFGSPRERIPVRGGVVHWLYPQKGLDIAVDPERKEVFQYVAPKDFQRLVADPLRATATSARTLMTNSGRG